MIISVENRIGRATSVARRTTPSLESSTSGRLSRPLRIVSIITIAPSTSIPKSIAPSDSRLAGISVIFIRIKAINSDNGIVTATSSAPRQLPRNRINTSTTSSIPSNSVCDTVCSVVLTRSVRSMNGWIETPSGNISPFSSSTASCTPCSTCEGVCPRSICTIPSTPS